MIKSMTGYGRGESVNEQRSFTIEIRSVNHRYLDVTVKLPRRFGFAEDYIKGIIKSNISRGKMDVFVNLTEAAKADSAVQLNLDLAKHYYEALQTLEKEIPGLSNELTTKSIASFPDVLTVTAAEDDEDAIKEEIRIALENAIASFNEMRQIEGSKLLEDILFRGNIIEETVTEIEAYAPSVEKQYYEKLQARIKELIGNSVEIPEDRIVTEAAIFADKANITEEIVRLKSHVSQLRKITDNPKEPVGKKLDFLVQEMNRESNTIGSKANDLNITNKVLILKAEIEKIREQIQNIE